MDTPPKRVMPGLSWFSSECGTLACFGGHLAQWPEFQEQGVFATESGAPRIEGGHNAYGTAKVLFGCDGMFECCPAMQEPHAVVLRRLDAAIESRRRALASVTVEETCSEGAEEVWPSWLFHAARSNDRASIELKTRLVQHAVDVP